MFNPFIFFCTITPKNRLVTKINDINFSGLSGMTDKEKFTFINLAIAQKFTSDGYTVDNLGHVLPPVGLVPDMDIIEHVEPPCDRVELDGKDAELMDSLGNYVFTTPKPSRGKGGGLTTI